MCCQKVSSKKGFLRIKSRPFETRIQALGIEDLRGVLSEKVKGKLRVTSNKRILKSVSDYVESVATK